MRRDLAAGCNGLGTKRQNRLIFRALLRSTGTFRLLERRTDDRARCAATTAPARPSRAARTGYLFTKM
jgi:hypothetical protein